MGESDNYLRLVVSLATAVVILGLIMISLHYMTNTDQFGIAGLKQAQVQRRYEYLEDFDSVVMSGASVNSLVMEFYEEPVAFIVGTTNYYYRASVDPSTGFYQIDLNNFTQYSAVDPRDVYTATVIYSATETPVGIQFVKG